MSTRTLLPVVILSFLFSSEARAQTTAPEKVVVSYPSKSITNFPILETGQSRGFYQKENLSVNLV